MGDKRVVSWTEKSQTNNDRIQVTLVWGRKRIQLENWGL